MIGQSNFANTRAYPTITLVIFSTDHLQQPLLKILVRAAATTDLKFKNT